jgi:flagellar basal-body rod protein FlgB
MPISDIPLLSMLRTRMHWHQERQQLLAQNVANSDSPSYRPFDLVPPDFSSTASRGSMRVGLARTDPAHLAASGGDDVARFGRNNQGDYEMRPSGNAVNLETEMMKVAENQMDYQAATTLYSHSLNLIKTALGKS